jgi:hypothetical protein
MKQAAILLLLSANIFALNIRHDERIVLQSADKKTTVLQRMGQGPEGGSSMEFVLRRDGVPDKVYLISRTFSPGDGSKPEIIKEADCRKALENLKKDAQDLRLFINPHACGGDRNKAVSPLAEIEAAGAEPHNCSADEIPYFEAGCDGRGTVRCWPQKVRPTPMQTCLCNGKQGNAPLPGGGVRWRHAGKCKP